MFVDLHIHSDFSDGSYTCGEIINSAKKHNVGVISITDHNSIENLNVLDKINEDELLIIPGVELDAIYNENNYHILGYGMDRNLDEFREVCMDNAQKQEYHNLLLLKKLCRDYKAISEEDYDSYHRPAHRGGWKLINYLFDKGITAGLYEGLSLYRKYGICSNQIPFLSVRDACNAIQKSGGIPILAHPVENIMESPLSQGFVDELKALQRQGIKGIECFYPLHSEIEEQFLFSFCQTNHLYITGGSDFHGDFFNKQKQKVGSQFINLENINIFI